MAEESVLITDTLKLELVLIAMVSGLTAPLQEEIAALISGADAIKMTGEIARIATKNNLPKKGSIV